MENMEMERLRYERAHKRIKQLAGFYKHLVVYLLVNTFLILLKWFRLDEGEQFLKFDTFSVAFFWGIGLAFHAFGVFFSQVFFGSDWEDRKVREIIEKQKQNSR